MAFDLAKRLTGPTNPYPLAVFRVVFFTGIALHFGPSLLYLGENYSAGAYRTQEWNEFLFAALPTLPSWLVALLAAVTGLAILAGLVGLYARAAAAVAGLGCYVFASFNGLPTQTLAVSTAWAVFFILAGFGGGDEALSVRGSFGPHAERQGDKTARTLILAQMMIGLFFAGIEKVAAGWLSRNEMLIVFGYPDGFMIREWAVGRLATPAVGWLATYSTLVVELVVPPLILVPGRARLAAVLVYEAFFLGIIATMEVPPLFYCLYAGGGLLAIDDAWWSRLFTPRSARTAPTARGSKTRARRRGR